LLALAAAFSAASPAPPPAPAPHAGGAPELVLNIDHVGEITAIAVSPDSRRIASGSRDRTVKLWDAATGRLLPTLTGHRQPVPSVTCSAEGGTVYSGSRDGTVKAWVVETGRLLGPFASRDPIEGTATAIAAQPLKTADGINTLLMARAGGPENAVQLWRAGG